MQAHFPILQVMKQSLIALSLSAACLSAPAIAQETGDGPSLMEQGIDLFFRGLQEELAPTLEDFQGLALEMGPQLHGFMREMGPKFGELLGEIEDWSTYHAPEILPNGDIIIRKKSSEETPLKEGETDI